MNCPNCNNNIPDGSKFCNHCGQRIEIISGVKHCSNPQCGKEIPSDSMFCPFCGNKQSMILHSDESIVIIHSEGDNCLLRGCDIESEQQETVRISRGKNVISSRFYQWIKYGIWVVSEYAKEIKSFDLSSFDTSKVTDMHLMFEACSSLETLDLSSFDTSKVTNMSFMFGGCGSLETLDLSSFDTSKVTGMGGMFYNCRSLETLDLSGFDTSKVTDMRSMFEGCSSLETLDLSGFDTSNVTDMSLMFERCYSLKTVVMKNCNYRTIQMISQALADAGLSPKLITS